MITLDDLRRMGGRDLHAVLANGHPVDPDALADRQMNGVALGVPAIAKPFTWTKFRKTFKREDDGSLRGWNVKCAQTDLDRPWENVVRGGSPVTYWYYRVVTAEGIAMPRDWGNGLIIDYTIGGNGRLDFMNRVRDPLVAVNEGDNELLLGLSWANLGVAQTVLPFTFFALAGGEPLDHDATPPRG